jgi:hypothetical protein
MKNNWISFAASVLSVMALVSCSKKESKSYTRIMMINAAPHIRTTVLSSDETIPYASTLDYGMNTGYVRMESGSRVVGMYINDTMTIKTALEGVTGGTYSLFLLDSAGRASTMAVNDDLKTPSGDRAFFRFLNLSANAVPMDVVITHPDTSIHLVQDTVFHGISYPGNTGFKEMTPGVYKMIIARKDTHDTVCRIPTFSLSAGKIYSIYLKGVDSTYNGPAAISTSTIQHN